MKKVKARKQPAGSKKKKGKKKKGLTAAYQKVASVISFR